MMNAVICGVRINRISAMKRTIVLITSSRELKNLFKSFSPFLWKMLLKIGMIEALIEPATMTIKSMSGMVNAAQNMSYSWETPNS